MRHTVLALVSVVTLAALADDASACSCAYASPCALSRNADAVFVGDVVDVTDGAADDWSATVRMRVVRAGKGVETGQLVALQMPSERTSCAMGVAVGRRWMVFATRRDGRFGTSGCAGTYRLSLDERLPDLPGRGGTVYGSLAWPGPGNDGPRRGLAAVPVWIDTPDGRIATRTADDGGYRLDGVPSGKWKVQFDLGPGRTAHVFVDMSVGDDCYNVHAMAMPAGGLAGAVVDEAGAPVAAATITAILASDTEGIHEFHDRTDERGEYWIRALSPGAYVVRVGDDGEVSGRVPYRPQFYPAASDRSAAQAIDVDGDVVRLDPIVMRGALPTATIAVDIVCGDGTRPAKAFATADRLDDEGGREYASSVAGGSLRTIRVLFGRRYAVRGMVHARTQGPDGTIGTEWIQTSGVEIDPARPPDAVRLRADLQRCDDPGGPSAGAR